ncbi:MAG: MTH1187 family thiamine-binding protein [Thermodesulfobacteriota bacterium]
MIVQFSIVPIGTGESLSEFVSHIAGVVENSGLPYSLNAMGTVVEGRWEEVMALIKECKTRALKETGRAFINISMDVRPAKPMDRMREKVRSVQQKSGGRLKE